MTMGDGSKHSNDIQRPSVDFKQPLRGNLQERCRGPAGSHKRDPYFVGACAIEMHINISQKTSEEPL